MPTVFIEFILQANSRPTDGAVRVHAVVKRVTEELSVTFVDLFREPHDDPFVKEPARCYCPDRLHPSGEGYAIWFAALIAQVPLARFLADAGSD